MTNPTSYFNDVYDATYDELRRYAVIKARRVQDVEDLLQNTYARFYQHICRHGSSVIENARSYLVTVLRRELAHYYADAARRQETCLDDAAEAQSPVVTSDGSRRLETDEIWACVRRESELSQKIFILFYGYGMKTGQIAEALGQKDVTVRSRLSRTRDNIRSQLYQEEA